MTTLNIILLGFVILGWFAFIVAVVILFARASRGDEETGDHEGGNFGRGHL